MVVFIGVGIEVFELCKLVVLIKFVCFCSDFGFKMSEDLLLEVCVLDFEFFGRVYFSFVFCFEGFIYRRIRG